MGGCSSKPKTAEFEGDMEIQEEKAQDEAVKKSFDTERIGVGAGLTDIDDKKHQTSVCGIQNGILKEEVSCSCNMLAETERHSCAGFDATGEFKAERQGSEDHCRNVKGALDKEINGDLSFKRLPAVKEEVAKGSSDLYEDPVLVEVSALRLEETPTSCTMKAASMISVEQPLAFLEKSFETQEQPVMPEYETSASHRHVSHGTGAFYLQQDESTTDVCLEPEKPMVSQECVAPEVTDLKLQMHPFELPRERAEAGYGNEEQIFDVNQRQRVQVGMTEMKFKDKYIEEGKGMVELESQDGENGHEERVDNCGAKSKLEESKECEIAVNGAYNLSKQRGEVSLKDKSLFVKKDQHPKSDAIDFDVCRNNYPPLGVEHNCSRDSAVHEAPQMQAKVVDEADSMDAFAKTFIEPRGEPVSKDHWPEDNDVQKKTTGEAFPDDSWYILEKVEVQDNDSPMLVSQETSYMDLPKSGGDFSVDASRNATMCDDKVLSSSEVLVASKTLTGSQLAQVLDPVGLAFHNIVSQEISAPDIDDVLEKLASEFERQEKLARSNS
ncbi:hypothetical protein L7F22_009558 [Adiantum nelumboides]|nr:hypothetical protein [Adiantum nelumboides]